MLHKVPEKVTISWKGKLHGLKLEIKVLAGETPDGPEIQTHLIR